MSGQCFATPELSASFQTHSSLEITTDLGSLSTKSIQDLVYISLDIPQCSLSQKMCTVPLQVCIDTGTLVRADKLDRYTDWFSGTIAVDLHFVNGHCSFMTETVKVEKMSVCRSYIMTIGKTLDLRVGLSFSNVTNERLFVSVTH